MEKLIPLISPSVAGPLGIVHLPRLWAKAILAEAGALDEEYFPHYHGFNKRTTDALGLDPDAWFAYLRTQPAYPATEQWIAARVSDLPAAVAAANAAIAARDPRAAEIDAEDWSAIHAWIVAHRGERLEPIVPAISTSSAGPAGMRHLPRLWIKALLNGVGALPEGYNSGCGLDAYVAGLCGLDLDAAVAFIHRELPSYPQFEAYVCEQVPGIADPVALASYNDAILTRQKPEEKAAAERLEAGVPELAFREVIMCNDMLDWKALHDEALARRSSPTPS
jgi:hypothetical protein